MKTMILLAACLLVGCRINARRLAPIPTDQPFAHMECEQLGQEKDRVESEYKVWVGRMRHGTYKRLAELNGETDAINDSIAVHGCRLAPVKIPPVMKPRKY